MSTTRFFLPWTRALFQSELKKVNKLAHYYRPPHVPHSMPQLLRFKAKKKGN